MPATKTTTRTRAGNCPVHGDVQGEKSFPVASWPIVAYIGRRVSARFKPYHCMPMLAVTSPCMSA
jgi:hypothetical protein